MKKSEELLQCRLELEDRESFEAREFIVNEFLAYVSRTRQDGYIIVIMEQGTPIYWTESGTVSGMIGRSKIYKREEYQAAEEQARKLREFFRAWRVQVILIPDHITQDLKGKLFYERYQYA